MKHSEYIKLTSLLNGMSGNADTLRLLFSRTDQAKQHPGFQFKHIMLDSEEKAVHETLDLMDRTVDGWIDENQERADRKLGPTADCRKLYLVMAGFIDATETPVAGANVLYVRIRKQCRAWMDQAVTWFPSITEKEQGRGTIDRRVSKKQKVEQFKVELQSMPEYQLAIDDGTIIPPFTWTKGKRDLVEWLQNNIIPTRTDRNGFRHPQWSIADNVFIKDGKPIPGTVLNDTAQHMKDIQD